MLPWLGWSAGRVAAESEPMMNKPLYDQDFLRWTAEQARALHEAAHVGSNLPLDWDNLAEEIESLGRAQRNQLASRIATILDHLMKLQASPAEASRRGSEATIGSGPGSSACCVTARVCGRK